LSEVRAGLSFGLGAFIVGVGIPFRSACAAGAFVNTGEGFLKSLVVAVAFIAGSTPAATDPFFGWWGELPHPGHVGIGWYGVLVSGGVLAGSAGLYTWQLRRERRLEGTSRRRP